MRTSHGLTKFLINGALLLNVSITTDLDVSDLIPFSKDQIDRDDQSFHIFGFKCRGKIDKINVHNMGRRRNFQIKSKCKGFEKFLRISEMNRNEQIDLSGFGKIQIR